MAMYDRQWFKDVRAILDKASVLKVEPKQSVEPVKAEPPFVGGNVGTTVYYTPIYDGQTFSAAAANSLQNLYLNNATGLSAQNQLANLYNQSASGLQGRTKA